MVKTILQANEQHEIIYIRKDTNIDIDEAQIR